MTCDEWPHKKYFGSSVILLELIEVSLLILTLNGATQSRLNGFPYQILANFEIFKLS